MRLHIILAIVVVCAEQATAFLPVVVEPAVKLDLNMCPLNCTTTPTATDRGQCVSLTPGSAPHCACASGWKGASCETNCQGTIDGIWSFLGGLGVICICIALVKMKRLLTLSSSPGRTIKLALVTFVAIGETARVANNIIDPGTFLSRNRLTPVSVGVLSYLSLTCEVSAYATLVAQWLEIAMSSSAAKKFDLSRTMRLVLGAMLLLVTITAICLMYVCVCP